MIKENYIFLDIDGVLNSSQTKERTPSGDIGVDDKYIEILKKVMDVFDAKIILSSDWKLGWSKEYDCCDEDVKYLINKLKKYDIHIFDKTIDKKGGYYRAQGIEDFLKEHPGTDKYIIFDDNQYDFYQKKEISSHLISTLDGIDTPDAYNKDYNEDVLKIVLLIREITGYKKEEYDTCII